MARPIFTLTTLGEETYLFYIFAIATWKIAEIRFGYVNWDINRDLQLGNIAGKKVI